jgi:hypothetical protein
MQQGSEGKIVWIIDSGATDHVCNDREAFYSIKPCETPTKYKTAGHDVVSEEAGVVAMQLPHAKKLVIADVTYLPSAPANLLSLGTLQQRGWTFDFAKGYITSFVGSNVGRSSSNRVPSCRGDESSREMMSSGYSLQRSVAPVTMILHLDTTSGCSIKGNIWCIWNQHMK